MKSKKNYRKGKETFVVTNSGHEFHFVPYYPKKNPENWEEEICSALEYVLRD